MRQASRKTGQAVKAAAALGVAALVAAGAATLARVDGVWGAAYGPDRWLEPTSGGQVIPAQTARAALAHRPIDGQGYRALAASDAAGSDTHGDVLREIAVRRWPRDALARSALADAAFARGDVRAALTHVDAVLRVKPALADDLAPQLLSHLGDAALRGALVERLRLGPPWRGVLVSRLADDEVAARDADALLADLDAVAELSDTEVSIWARVLERAGKSREARELWLDRLPEDIRADAGHVFDGRFQHLDIKGPFAWESVPPAGVDFVPPQFDTDGLRIEFGGRASKLASPRQRLALPAGRYRLIASSDNRAVTERLFEWRVTCQPEGRRLATLQLAARGAGETVVTFDVPADCPSQSLQLVHDVRYLGEQVTSGTLVLKNVGIVPTD